MDFQRPWVFTVASSDRISAKGNTPCKRAWLTGSGGCCILVVAPGEARLQVLHDNAQLACIQATYCPLVQKLLSFQESQYCDKAWGALFEHEVVGVLVPSDCIRRTKRPLCTPVSKMFPLGKYGYTDHDPSNETPLMSGSTSKYADSFKSTSPVPECSMERTCNPSA
jgi:hypothetical protein